MPVFVISRLCLVVLAAVLLLCGRILQADEIATAAIVEVYYEEGELVVIGEAPAGYRKITLESKLRVERKSWEPRAVKRIEPTGGEVEFRIPYRETIEVLRLRLDVNDSLPTIFFSGATTFNSGLSTVGSTSGTTAGTTSGNSDGGATGGATGGLSGGTSSGTTSGTTAGTTGETTGGVSAGTPGTGEPRTVIESDIWKVSGNKMYFFNQARGLQVVDITASANPVLTGTIPLPAVGEQMHLLKDGYVVLLARMSACAGANGRVLLVNTSGSVPRIEKEVTTNGRILESRLVGEILYLATAEFRPVPNDSNSWEQKTLLRSFDFRNPAAVPEPKELWIETDVNVVSATEKYFLLGGSETRTVEPGSLETFNGSVTFVMVTGPFSGANYNVHFASSGTFTLSGGAVGAGIYSYDRTGKLLLTFTGAEAGDIDEFNLHFTSSNSGFITGRSRIGEAWHDCTGQFSMFQGTISPWEASFLQQPIVSYVDITDPAGEMVLAGKVSTIGTLQDKFKVNLSGDVLTTISRASFWTSPTTVETFSIANPSAPIKLGSVSFGNNEQLHATRFAGNKAYVVTFRTTDPLWVIDLADPAQPRILGELQIPGWSTYIEPLPNERLLTVGIGDNQGAQLAVQLFDVSDPATPKLLDKELLGTRFSSGEVTTDEKAFGFIPEANLALVPFQDDNRNSIVQLVDIGENTLTLRGQIEHAFTARRATLIQDHVISVSARELISVDASDRDEPQVTKVLPLSWPVHQVFPHGDYLVEIDRAPWFQQRAPVVRVVATASPEKVLDSVTLTNMPLAMILVHKGKLLIAQHSPGIWQNENTALTNPPNFFLAAIDLAALPELSISHQGVTAPHFPAGTAFTPHFIDADILVIDAQIAAYQGNSTTGGWGGGTTGWMGTTTGETGGATGGLSGGTTAGLIGATGGMTGSTTGGYIPLPEEGLYHYSRGARRFLTFDLSADEPSLKSDIGFARDNAFSLSPSFAAEELLYFSFHSTRAEISGTNSYITYDSYWEYETNVVDVTNVTQIPQLIWITNISQRFVQSFATNITIATNLVIEDYTRTIYRQQFQTGPGRLARLTANGAHLLALEADGRTIAWGNNIFWQLGRPTDSFSPIPTEVVGVSQIVSLSAGRWHSTALDANGKVWAWGANSYWQLGFEPLPSVFPPMPPTEEYQPTIVQNLPVAKSISAGGEFNLVLAVDGSLWAWGENTSGQLGDGSFVSRSRPRAVAGLSGVALHAAGVYHSVALDDEGRLWGWGNNSFKQIGNAPEPALPSPTLMRSSLSARALAAGLNHTLALDGEGRVFEWGDSTSGQLSQPADGSAHVAGLPQVQAITAGFAHSVALAEDGSVWTWGWNRFGQLGLDTPQTTVSPQPVPGVSNIVSIAATYHSTHALTAEGVLYSWGDNQYGQLGTGEKFEFTSRVPVEHYLITTNIIPTTTSIWETNILPGTIYLKETNYVTATNVLPRYIQVPRTNFYTTYRHFDDQFLQVVDFGDVELPSLRRAVQIPATLVGVSHGGQIIYTLGPKYDANGTASQENYLSALAYDGVEAYLLDTIAAPWSMPLIANDNVYFVSEGSTPTDSVLGAWRLDETGKLGSVEWLPLSETGLQLTRLATGSLLAFNEEKAFVLDTYPALRMAGAFSFPQCLVPMISELKWSPKGIAWLPLGEYGLLSVSVDP